MIVEPQVPDRRPFDLQVHGDVRTDDWYWLRDFDDPAVRDYLESENRYADHVLAAYDRLRHGWELDWRSRTRFAKNLLPGFRSGGFRYDWQTSPGTWGQLSRSPAGSKRRRTELVVDLNVYGARSLGFTHGAVVVSPDHRRVAFTFERLGNERYTLRIRDIERRHDYGYALEPVGPSVAWVNATTLLYTRLDQRGVPNEVWCHRAEAPDDDVRIYREPDRAAFVAVSRTASGAFAKIVCSTHSWSEVRLVPTAAFGAAPRLVEPRRPGVGYDVEHHPDEGGRLFILVHEPGHGGEVVTTPATTPGRKAWRPFYKASDRQLIDGFGVSARNVLVSEHGADRRIVLLDAATRQSRVIPLSDTPLSARVHVLFGGDFHEPSVVVGTTSPLDPGTHKEVDVATGSLNVIHRAPAPKGFDHRRYVLEERSAISADGAEVPLSVFHRRGRAPGGPAVLDGYGAYGISNEHGFDLSLLTLADRGWLLAFSHGRGGGELGPAWHQAGRRMKKRTSVDDFVACAERLIVDGTTTTTGLAARGASAGGLLVCAAANRRPDLFRAVVAAVPFVDCLTTLLDPASPLTESGWAEWGNPVDDRDVYEYIRSYSPYDNIQACDYPAMLVTAGLNDARVGYWEPAKFVAKLRATKTDDRVVLLKTAMEAGHGGAWEHHRSNESFVMAFLVSQLEGAAVRRR